MSSKNKLILMVSIIILIAGGVILYVYKGGIEFRAEELTSRGPNVETKDNKIYVNGENLFPIGLWGVPADSIFVNSNIKLPLTAEELKNAGFNVLTPANPVRSTNPREEDKIIEGLYRFVFIRQKDGLNPVCQAKAPSSGKDSCFIRRIIKDNLPRTDVVGWFGADEPGVKKQNQPQPISPAALKAGYDLAKAIDPLKRPIWINQAPFGVPPPPSNPDYTTLVPYNTALNILSSHIYPIPESSILSIFQHKNLAVIGEFISKLLPIAENTTKHPLWLFLQGSQKNGFAEYKNNPCGGCDQKPTKEQQGFMAYEAIISGANGLYWFGAWNLSKDDPVLQAILDVVKEINQSQKVILAPKSPSNIKVSTPAYTNGQGDEEPIHLAIKRLNDKDYIIAANNLDKETSATFETPVSRVLKYPTAEELAGAGDNFKINFPSFGATILEIVPAPGKSLPPQNTTSQQPQETSGESQKESRSKIVTFLIVSLATLTILTLGYVLLRKSKKI